MINSICNPFISYVLLCRTVSLMRLMNQANPLSEIGRAVINAIEHGYKKQIIESKDFKILVNTK